MGVREIPSPAVYFFSYINNQQIDCESQLEADFCLTLEFVRDIQSYESQPVKVIIEGRPRPTYPDFLIYFKAVSRKRPLLAEVKHTKDLTNPKKISDISIKLAAFEQYAKAEGWEFKLATDKEIRGTRLENYQFLYPHTEPPAFLNTHFERILTVLEKSGSCSASTILEKAGKDKASKGQILRCVWHMVRSGVLTADLDRPLTNSSVLGVGSV